jgi:Inner membrane protein YgaP-like, transmembrane domain
MSLERCIRLIAGSFILISLGLAHWVNPNWLWFTAFVGANLFQSALTGWCLMEDILKKLGVARDVVKLKASAGK